MWKYNFLSMAIPSICLTLNMDVIHYQLITKMSLKQPTGTFWHSDPSQAKDMILSVSDECICRWGDNSLNLGFLLLLEEWGRQWPCTRAVRHWSPMAVIACQAADIGFDWVVRQRNPGVCSVSKGPSKCSDGRLEQYTLTFCIRYCMSQISSCF